MKTKANVFATSTVRKERILRILWSWKFSTLHNWFTSVSIEKLIQEYTKILTDAEKAISESWKNIIKLVLTCFSFDPIKMSWFWHRSP